MKSKLENKITRASLNVAQNKLKIKYSAIVQVQNFELKYKKISCVCNFVIPLIIFLSILILMMIYTSTFLYY